MFGTGAGSYAYDPGVQAEDAFYRRCLGWELRFVWWPTKCYISKRRMWLERAYRGTSVLTGPGDTIYEYRWHDRHEHIVWKIKGN